MSKTLSKRWDLDSLFKGGSSSEELKKFVHQLHNDLSVLEEKLVAAVVPETNEQMEEWAALLLELQGLMARMQEAGSFAGCLTAENVHDEKAKQWQANLKPYRIRIGACMTQMEDHISEMTEETFEALLKLEALEGLTFYIREKREWTEDKLSSEQEKLANALAQDGYHGWGEMYNTIVSSLKIPFDENGETKQLSAGQAQNKLESSHRPTRVKMFEEWEKAWSSRADLFAETLNHLSGFRLSLYEKRGWEDPLKEPLMINRMSKDTLDAMWGAIEDMKADLIPYMRRKAELIGVDQLEWHDVHAPIGEISDFISYEDGAETISQQFAAFSPKLSTFTDMAFQKNWIEAEDRENKRPGGFCTTLPVSDETRIFMTYEGTPSNLATLAHELGHAYHQYAMKGLPYFATKYAMNVAETASTFAEQIVADASIENASSKEEEISLLDAKLNRGLAFFMNLHSRFLFETRFYEARKDGWLTASEISELMVEAQKEAYCGELASYHPHFWAAKLHFHTTNVPFYNFPYTFGYLFSMGIYARAKEEGESFENKYVALLRDTASMSVEDLAEKHLQKDLTQQDFWKQAARSLLNDTKRFLELTK
ncbi:M3 family oligoendopeptidase [Alteribacillus sp. HJP-4]|uniref:M3 family oligoendopeptidase n=1 Tax=Alteribacillus sp. HJP-4 TaxID=2775394 RepID=UPI0035CD399C